MGFDQYHEPPEELSQEIRTLARIFASLTEEAEAIGWYEQRLAVEQDQDARAIIADSRHEEYKHFAMDLEFLFRKRPEWAAIAKGILFQDGDITENAEGAEENAEIDDPGPDSGPRLDARLARDRGPAMSHLLRAHAPISERGWELIDEEARDRLTPGMASRRLVDFSGPHGWEFSSVTLGRVDPADVSLDGVTAVRRRIQPVVEFKVPFSVSRAELLDGDRGAEDVDFDDLDRAARKFVEAENAAVFHGSVRRRHRGHRAAVPARPDRAARRGERLPGRGRRARSTCSSATASRARTASRSAARSGRAWSRPGSSAATRCSTT